MSQCADFGFRVTCSPATVEFPLSLRIPEWTTLSEMTVVVLDGKPLHGGLVGDAKLPGFGRVDLSCVGHCELLLTFDMKIVAKTGKRPAARYESRDSVALISFIAD